MLEFSCPGCGKTLETKLSSQGKCGQCPSCGTKTTAPSPYLGKRVKIEHLESASDELFLKGEQVLAAVTGQVREAPDKNHGGFSLVSTDTTKGDSWHRHYLIATDRRVLLWGRGYLRSSLDTLNYSSVRSVEVQNGFTFSAIVLNVGRTEHFTNVSKNEALEISKIIREKIADATA